MNTPMKSARSRFVKTALGVALALGTAQALAAPGAVYDVTLKGTTPGPSTGQVRYNNSDTATAGCVGDDHVPPSSTITVREAALSNNPIVFDKRLDLNVCTYTTELLKPGTGGNNELLKQGSNVEGLKGSLTNDKNSSATTCSGGNAYKLTFDLAGTTQPFTRSYEIFKCENVNGGRQWVSSKTGGYHIQNPVSAAPEPGSLLLLLPGLGALAWSRFRRARGQGADA